MKKYQLYCSVCHTLDSTFTNFVSALKGGDKHKALYEEVFGETDHIVTVREKKPPARPRM